MNNTKKALALAAVVIVALVGYKVAVSPKESMEATPTTDTTSSAPVATLPTATVKKLSTQVTYKEPAGESPVGFTVMVSDGVITDAQVEVLATNEDTQRFQGDFQQALPAALKGKKLADLTAIDRVGGASLTTKAFNEALATLKAQM